MPSGKATCRQRDILLTRFPFSDLIGSKVRPVLVLSNDAYNRRFSDVLICAITSSPRPHEYATDLGAKDLEQGVLKAACCSAIGSRAGDHLLGEHSSLPESRLLAYSATRAASIHMGPLSRPPKRLMT